MSDEELRDLANHIIAKHDQCSTMCNEWYKKAPHIALCVLMMRMMQQKMEGDPVAKVIADFALVGIGAAAIEASREKLEKEDEDEETKG